MKGLGVYDLASITCNDAGSSVMPLGDTCGSYPVGRSWGLGSSESSFQAALNRGMPQDSLRCQSFVGVGFFCVASSECSSNRFFNLLGLFPSSCDTQWIMYHKRPYDTWDKHANLWCLILWPLTLIGMVSVQDRLYPSPLITI